MTRAKMDQDDLEEELFYQSIFGHLQLLLGVLQSSDIYRNVYDMVTRKESLYVLISLLVVLYTIIRFDKQGRVLGWLRGLTSCCTLVNSFYVTDVQEAGVLEWSEVTANCTIYSMQGRRPANEDRAVACAVNTETGPVHIYAVMDGHGGQFAVNFAKKHLISSIKATIAQLKLITSKIDAAGKITKYEENFGQVPVSVRSYLGVSEAEYKQISPHQQRKAAEEEEERARRTRNKNNKSGVSQDNSTSETSEAKKNGDDDETENDADTKEDKEESSVTSRSNVVLSSRTKPIEEVPSLMTPKTNPKTPKTPQTDPKASRKTALKTRKPPKLKLKASSSTESSGPELTDYIDSSGEIIYAKLIKDEIAACDKKLVTEAKKANAIGGSTLLLGILDAGVFWVANVGDSRGVFCSAAGHTIPLSFDHKPCQLKEKRRIQEAGGFVSLNGVWRVQGVLATSRALGDYPLKEKKVVVSDPDVLSFSVKEHNMDFAVLASDGLWDTHSNEEVTEMLRKTKRDLTSVRGLAGDSYARGSTDNITILAINF